MARNGEERDGRKSREGGGEGWRGTGGREMREGGKKGGEARKKEE